MFFVASLHEDSDYGGNERGKQSSNGMEENGTQNTMCTQQQSKEKIEWVKQKTSDGKHDVDTYYKKTKNKMNGMEWKSKMFVCLPFSKSRQNATLNKHFTICNWWIVYNFRMNFRAQQKKTFKTIQTFRQSSSSSSSKSSNDKHELKFIAQCTFFVIVIKNIYLLCSVLLARRQSSACMMRSKMWERQENKKLMRSLFSFAFSRSSTCFTLNW